MTTGRKPFSLPHCSGDQRLLQEQGEEHELEQGQGGARVPVRVRHGVRTASTETMGPQGECTPCRSSRGIMNS